MNQPSEQSTDDAKVNELRRKLGVFQQEFYYQLVALTICYERKLFLKSEVYNKYYKVSDKTFKLWLEFFMPETFSNRFFNTSKTVNQDQWTEIVNKLGYCNRNIRQTKSKAELIQILYKADKPSSRDYRNLKSEFVEKVSNGEEIFNWLNIFPPNVVVEFLEKCNDDLVYPNEKRELNSFGVSPVVRLSGNATVTFSKGGIKAKANDDKSSVEIKPSSFEEPKYFNPRSQNEDFEKRQIKAFKIALKKSGLGYKEKLRKTLIELFEKKEISGLLKLSIRV